MWEKQTQQPNHLDEMSSVFGIQPRGYYVEQSDTWWEIQHLQQKTNKFELVIGFMAETTKSYP
jgi:hypothetical protein